MTYRRRQPVRPGNVLTTHHPLSIDLRIGINAHSVGHHHVEVAIKVQIDRMAVYRGRQAVVNDMLGPGLPGRPSGVLVPNHLRSMVRRIDLTRWIADLPVADVSKLIRLSQSKLTSAHEQYQLSN